MELFVKEVGIPPMEAIVANTSRNAWLMGLEGEVGVIAPGKLTDIVIWNSDPIADITVLQRPSEISTIKDGRVVDRGAVGFRQLPDEPPRARASISDWQEGPRVRIRLPPAESRANRRFLVDRDRCT
jgi:adenine deaminase